MSISIQSVSGLSDVFLSDNYELVIPNLPSALGATLSNPTSASNELTIKNVTTSVPELQNQQVSVWIHRQKVKWAGRRDFGDSITTSFIETASTTVVNTLYAWSNLIVPLNTGIPNPKSTYIAPKLTVYMLNASNQQSLAFNLYNVWPSKITPSELGSSSEGSPVTFSVTWTYDWFDTNTVINPENINYTEDSNIVVPDITTAV